MDIGLAKLKASQLILGEKGKSSIPLLQHLSSEVSRKSLSISYDVSGALLNFGQTLEAINLTSSTPADICPIVYELFGKMPPFRTRAAD